MATILQPTEENAQKMGAHLQAGGLLAAPTETVYGLAANALDPGACQRIFEAKGRPASDPLICHIGSLQEMEQICEPNELAIKLAERFWPGALTLVLPKKNVVPDIVTAGLPSVAVRCPQHKVFQTLKKHCPFPLAAPSANPFAYISPTTAEHVQAGLGAKVPYILDGGPCRLGLESTILDVRDQNAPKLLRHGALSLEELQDALGASITVAANSDSEGKPALAPGSQAKHYSPQTPLKLADNPISAEELQASLLDVAYLLLMKPGSETRENVYWLSETGELSQIAANLYGLLHSLDRKGYKGIVAEKTANAGLGMAINDRLRRAAATQA